MVTSMRILLRLQKLILIATYLAYTNTNCYIIEDAVISNDYSDDNSLILSRSNNLTVHANETIILPCIVQKAPNTVVIWNQCEDPSCSQLRIPLTVNKENFIEDLRFRVLSENIKTTTTVATVKNIKSLSSLNSKELSFTYETSRADVSSWNLEIRKFSKSDEGCYQCQLNSFKDKAIHYCLKLQTKVYAKPTQLTVRLNESIKLKCYSDENVRLSHIKWYRNGHKLVEEPEASSNHGLIIERKPINNHLHSTLLIKQATLNDAGTYTCKFGHLKSDMHVNVAVSGDKLKSSEIRSNPDENQKAYKLSSLLSNGNASTNRISFSIMNLFYLFIFFVVLKKY